VPGGLTPQVKGGERTGRFQPQECKEKGDHKFCGGKARNGVQGHHRTVGGEGGLPSVKSKSTENSVRSKIEHPNTTTGGVLTINIEY